MGIVKAVATKIDNLADANVKLVTKLASANANLLIKYSNWVLQPHIYERVRHLTKPLHWLWINSWLKSIAKAHGEFYPFKDAAVYIVTGEPGSGKSSLAMEIMHRAKVATGKGSYINTAIEVPRVDEKTGQKYILHPRFKLLDFFDKTIIKYPNHFRFVGMHIDEAHIEWQYRSNTSGDYMRTFAPFMEYAVGVRQYIGQIFLYTQMDKVDTQLMSLAAAGHICDVQVAKAFDYLNWMLTGDFAITIVGWNLTFYKAVSNNGSWQRIELFKTFLGRTFDLKYFDSFNLRTGLKNVTFDRQNIKEAQA